MTTKAWPESILGRAVLRQGFEQNPQSAIERFEADSGLPRGRPYNTNPLVRIPCQFRFSEFQFAFFKAWYKDVAKFGGAWFTIYLPMENVTYREVLARTVGQPKYVPRGANGTVVQLEFEARDSQIYPDGIVDLVLTFGAEGVQQMDAALEGATLQPAFVEWAEGFAA